MKRSFFILLIASACVLTASAQPAKRRADAVQQAKGQGTPAAQAAPPKQTTQNAPRGASYRDFPTAQPMPADAAWRRDIYRSIDLMRDENAALYYPTLPQDGRMNLFSYLFKLLLRKQIKAYDTKLDANEDFSEGNEVTARTLMDRYKMHYETKDGRLRVSDADIPSDEVKMFYIKESVYYDQHTSTFHTRVTALCPVLLRGDDDLGGTETRYPMFWVRFDDIAPQLGKLMLMGSNYNNAATLSADDFFTLGRYKGDIFRTVNMQDRLLANYCVTDSDMIREQLRIEGELTAFEDHIWGKDEKPATPAALAADATEAAADSTAAVDAAQAETKVSSRRGSSGRRGSKTASAPKQPKQKKPKAQKPKSSGRSGAGYSVRRERH